MVALSFNSTQYSPEYGTIPQLPAGKGYKGIIVKTEGLPNKSSQGNHLALTLQVIEGPLTGKQQIDRLNLFNPNEKTVEIANKQLSAYCHVTGQHMLQDTDQLCNHPFSFDIDEQANNPQYTQVTAIYNIDGSKPGASTPAQQQQAAPPAQPPVQPPQQQAWTPPVAPPVQTAAWTPAPAEAPPAAQPGGWGGAAPASPAPTGWGAK